MDDEALVRRAAKAIGSLPYPLNEYAIARTALEAVGAIKPTAAGAADLSDVRDREAKHAGLGA